MPNMIDLGMKRKDLHASEGAPAKPASEKDWENEKVYPCLSARGKQAELLGAETLEEGDLVRQEVLWKVHKRRKIEDGDNVDYELELHMVKGSDLQPEGKAEPEPAGQSEEMDGDDEGENPGIAFIMGRAARE